MGRRAATGFGAGLTAADALQGASLPDGVKQGVREVVEVEVPAGADPSRLGTYVQRAALDSASLAQVPDELQGLVQAEATRLSAQPGRLALAIDMGPTPAGQKMLARLQPVPPGSRPYLLFTLVDD